MAKHDTRSRTARGFTLVEIMIAMGIIIILVAIFVLEGVAITAGFMLTGGPAEAEASHTEAERVALHGEEEVYELVIADRFQNTKGGRAYTYDTEIYVTVRRKNRAPVEGVLKDSEAPIAMDVATVFRNADPAQLGEYSLGTLRRQIKAKLDQRIGNDQEGNPIVLDVVIPKCLRFRSDL